MSETRRDEGWWQAGDGRWYPPQARPQQPPPPQQSAIGRPTQVQQAPPGAPGQPDRAAARTGNAPSVTAVVLGCIGLMLWLVLLATFELATADRPLATLQVRQRIGAAAFYASWASPAVICSVLALIFGFAGRRKARRTEGEPGKGQATFGIILGAISILVSFVGIAILTQGGWT